MSGPALRVLPGGRTNLRSHGLSGDRRQSAPCPSGEQAATARPLPDDGCNAEWDELLKCCEAAWVWRDPESLARLGMLFTRLQEHVKKDWLR